MSGPFGSHNFMTKGAAPEGGQSLRFNDDDNAYLSWTPASAGNRKTWTWSGWVKRGNSGAEQYLYSHYSSSTNQLGIRFNANNTFEIVEYTGSYQTRLITSQVFRDKSAWYHFVVSVDTTQATSSDRVSIYVNGSKVTSFSTSTYPSLNRDTNFNIAGPHYLGNRPTNIVFDGYMAEVNFVDGLALDPTSFGETDANGQWVPIKEPSVTYGTNGFYLPFTNDYTVEGFNTVTYRGNGGTQYIGGVGFEPDLVWVKSRSNAYSHNLHDVIRGTSSYLISNSTNAENTSYTDICVFNSDGFTLSSASSANVSGTTNVAWAWDAGTGSAVSNTDGSITSTVKANPDYGFSIVSYTGTNSATETVGHGLSQAPDMVIVKSRDSAINFWCVYHSGVDATSPENYLMRLNTTDARLSGSVYFNNTAPTSSVFTIGTSSALNNTDNFISYCFHSVAGYSDFGSYSGTGASGNKITTGFKPAFVMIKKTDSIEDWCIYDNTRNPGASTDTRLEANDSAAEVSASSIEITFDSDGFTANGTNSSINTSGGTYIYMAFADKREAAFWLDQSGNNNDWTNNNMQESDISLDHPQNNFATLNSVVPNYIGTVTYSQGNLRAYASVNSGYAESTLSITSGKYYTEMLYESGGGTLSGEGLGFTSTGGGSNSVASGYSYRTNGTIYIDGTNSASVSTYTTGDVVAMAIDADNGEVRFYKNGTLVYTDTGLSYPRYTPFVWSRASTGAASVVVNFGQDSSFAGNKVAQGNVDGNGFGDFYYEPPAGYLALCTQNLPDPAIADGTEHFNTVLYTGDGSDSRAITGVGHQPDFVWIKGRSAVRDHNLYDAVRGAGELLKSNSTDAEATKTIMNSFDADGFTVSRTGGTGTNDNGVTYAAWNWKAGGTGVANTDGSISSTVSANPTAGFSIVGYSGNGTLGATVGHGLSQAPDMIIVKDRSRSSTLWPVYHSANTSAPETDYLRLNTTLATADSVAYWADTAPTSSVFSIGNSGSINTNGDDYIAYCFHSVEGYSKFGSYTGNGSTDGPFVYTGFRPAFVLWKNASTTSNWQIIDNNRDTYNVSNTLLNPNSSVAEAVSGGNIADFTSNGFKVRGTGSVVNGNGNNIIFMAFAESPFKYSSAR